jgi:hypothetical protein
LTLACLTLPHSTADVERIFSEVGNIKTYDRNRLEHDSLRGVILSHNRKRSILFEETPIDIGRAVKKYKENLNNE